MSRKFSIEKVVTHYQSVDDESLVVVHDGDTYRNQMSGESIVSFDQNDFVEVGRSRHHTCRPGDYPWDHWKSWAIESGVAENLADLGRALIREADQHNWSPALQHECGWDDDGHAMLQLAVQTPDIARERWEYLLRTDGERH